MGYSDNCRYTEGERNCVNPHALLSCIYRTIGGFLMGSGFGAEPHTIGRGKSITMTADRFCPRPPCRDFSGISSPVVGWHFGTKGARQTEGSRHPRFSECNFAK